MAQSEENKTLEQLEIEEQVRLIEMQEAENQTRLTPEEAKLKLKELT